METCCFQHNNNNDNFVTPPPLENWRNWKALNVTLRTRINKALFPKGVYKILSDTEYTYDWQRKMQYNEIIWQNTSGQNNSINYNYTSIENFKTTAYNRLFQYESSAGKVIFPPPEFRLQEYIYNIYINTLENSTSINTVITDRYLLSFCTHFLLYKTDLWICSGWKTKLWMHNVGNHTLRNITPSFLTRN